MSTILAKSRLTLADSVDVDFGMDWQPPKSAQELQGMSMDDILDYRDAREAAERMGAETPTVYGWRLPMWKMVTDNWAKYSMHVILGGVRSSKSTFASRLCVKVAGDVPEAEIRAWHVNEARSIEDQQRFVYEALPRGIKELPNKRHGVHALQYSQKNGFAGGELILPAQPGYNRGSQINFNNYRQYQQDPNMAEGCKAHLNWLDEEAPLPLVETLQYRAVDYHGRIVLTFTTISGWSGLVSAIMSKRKTLVRRYAESEKRELPVMEESLSFPNTAIYYFWTQDSPFIDPEEFAKKLVGRSRAERLARAYGIPTKSAASKFPLFSVELNVIEHAKLPFIKDPGYKVTRYMALDPAGRKNWFMIWVAVDQAGTWYVYREWPDFDDWALPSSSPEGKAGPAQQGLGYGVRDYVEKVMEPSERGERIFDRVIDPRAGAAEKQTLEGSTTIMSDLDALSYVFQPAPVTRGEQGEIENGLQLINNLLAYNQDKEIDAVNTPKLYVSDRCQNVIFALQEYTAIGGKDEATKDPIDLLRYLAVAGISYVEDKGWKPRKFNRMY